MDMPPRGNTLVIMTIRSSKGRIALAAILLALIGTLIVAAKLLRNAEPNPSSPIQESAVEIDIDPLRFTAPGRSELTDAEVTAAVTLNAANPIVPSARIPAAPFFFDPALPAIERERAEHCLALAVYYEAATETTSGQNAVAQVVLNRVRHPVYPQTVCGVVFQGSWRATGCQFTFTCDGSLARVPSQSGWRRATAVAAAALSGYVEASVGTATHYHTDWVAPVWRTELVKLAQIGTHIFYRWPGRNGLPVAFAMRYRGGEVMGIGGPTLPATPDALPLAGAGNGFAPEPVESVAIDGPTRLRPAPLSADTQRPKLRADEERGTLTVGERQEPLQP